MTNEYSADQSCDDPRVTDSPEAIWLVYGDLDYDDTHATCCRDGDVAWCDEPQYSSDVRYVRGDLAERMWAQQANEVGRLRDRVTRLERWLEGEAYCPCCTGTKACSYSCTFAEDDPEANERMLEVRAVLYGG